MPGCGWGGRKTAGRQQEAVLAQAYGFLGGCFGDIALASGPSPDAGWQDGSHVSNVVDRACIVSRKWR
eukprot:COSAG01_NODE_23735_length_803_cov_1.805398_1_plen_67_part_10